MMYYIYNNSSISTSTSNADRRRCTMDVSFRDWAGLPANIVDLFVTKFDRFYDYVRFCGVCSEWRNVAFEAKVDHKGNLDVLKASRKKLPMLMFKTNENNDERRKMSLYSVSDKVTYTVRLPIPYKYRFVGSSIGWLFCVQETIAITLVNPFNNGCICLPVFEDPRLLFQHWYKSYLDYYIRKGILLSDPCVSRDSFGVVVLYTTMGKLAYFNSGEASWNFINSELLISDIIFYKDKLYGVSHFGQFVQINLDSRTIKTITRASELVPTSTIYLVESQDSELLMVKRRWLRRPDDWANGADQNVSDNEEENATDHSHNEEENSTNHSDNEEENSTNHSDNEEENSDSEYYDTDGTPNSDYEVSSTNSDDFLENCEPLSPIGYRSPEQRSYEFKVLKMIQHPSEKESPTWVEIKNIGEQALFVGNNHSVSVSTTEFPGCLTNSIYFTSDHHNFLFPYIDYGLEEDSGIFNLEDGRIYNHHVPGSSYKYMHPPIWLVPNPQEID